MFYIANMSHDVDNPDKELADYLSGIVSTTIAKGLNCILSNEDIMDIFYVTYFAWEEDDPDECENNFFKGIGKFFEKDGIQLSDDEVGGELLCRKMERMLQKMQDQERFYTFDLFEEYIFNKLAIADYDGLFADGNDGLHTSRFNREDDSLNDEEEKTAEVLVSKFNYEPQEAQETAMQVHRLCKMDLREDEDDSMFFWDNDYSFFFEDGLVNGLSQCGSPAGTFLGYGYDHAEEIFTDIGIKPPIRLLGTKEANRQMIRKVWREMTGNEPPSEVLTNVKDSFLDTGGI